MRLFYTQYRLRQDIFYTQYREIFLAPKDDEQSHESKRRNGVFPDGESFAAAGLWQSFGGSTTLPSETLGTLAPVVVFRSLAFVPCRCCESTG